LSYINFNSQTGEILAVANQPSEDENSFEIDYNKVKAFLTGDKSTSNYFVDFDYKKYHYILRLKAPTVAYMDASSTFYKIPENIIDATLTIIQQDSQLIFVADEDMQEKLEENKDCAINLRFSICAKNDPRRVYHIIEVSASELIKNNYTIELTLPENGVSIYTTKKLESYAHNRL
jgi:hypothetical protein